MIHDYNLLAGNGRGVFRCMLSKPFNAPFYGIKVTVGSYHTQSGLKINPDGQILRPMAPSPPICTAAVEWRWASPAKVWKAIF
jgi:hypothetical protein